jgi:glycosyltransferase involved in cell wall biosynthesis
MDVNLNILVVSPQIYPCLVGGVEVFNHYFVRGLASRGHKIWVITTCDYDFHDKSIISLRLNSKLLIHQTFSIDLQILYFCIKTVGKIDIIFVPYTSNSHLAYPLLLIKKLFKVVYVIVIHGGGMHPWKTEFIQKSFFLDATKIIAVSETIKLEYERRSSRNIEVIPPLIPFEHSNFSKQELRNKYKLESSTIILSLGSVKKIKGSDILLHAFIQLGEDYIKNNDLMLVYVGNGPLKSMLEMKVKEQSFQKHVRFMGEVSREKVPEMYKLADIYVIPSLFEGTPISLLEAMYNNLPIIGANANGINNIIVHEKNGLLFNKGDVNSLKHMITKLVDDSDLRSKLADCAKTDHLIQYKFQQIITQYIDIAKESLENTNE